MSPRARVAVTLEQCWHRVPGGVASSALGSVRALRAHTDLDLVGVSAWHPRPPEPAWGPTIPVAALPLPRLALYEAWHRARRPAVEAATGPVDVIHATGMAVPPRTAPLVVTVHDLYFLHDPSLFTARGVRFFERAIDLARVEADIVTVPSRTTLEDCVRHGFDPARLRWVPWGIEPVDVSPDQIAAIRRIHRLPTRFVLWTGTIEPRKNLPVLLEAFSRIGRDDVDLVVAGPEGWNDELAVLEHRLSGRVRRLGFVPAHHLPALYAAADVFCFPSRAEGFGLPVLEAMAQGTPVVTSSGTATAEIVEDDDGPAGDVPAGLLAPPGDPDAVAAALAGLLADPARAAAVGAAGRARAAGFSWSRTAEALQGAYDDARAR